MLAVFQKITQARPDPDRLRTLDRARREHEGALNRLRTERRTAAAELDHRARRLAALTDKDPQRPALEREAAELRARLPELDRRIQQTEAALSATLKELTGARAAADQAHIVSAQDLAALRDEIQARAQDVERLQRLIDANQAALQGVDAEPLRAAEQALQNVLADQAEGKAAARDVTAASKALEAARAEYDQQARVNEQVQATLAGLMPRLTGAQTALADAQAALEAGALHYLRAEQTKALKQYEVSAQTLAGHYSALVALAELLGQRGASQYARFQNGALIPGPERDLNLLDPAARDKARQRFAATLDPQ